jgi:hypothetical protein
MSKVLQQMPSTINRKQEEQLFNCIRVVYALNDALEKAGAAETVRLLDALLQQHAARSAGTLIAWAQQEPEQLISITAIEQPAQTADSTVSISNTERVWVYGWKLLDSIIAKIVVLDSSSTATHRIVTTTTEQLEQSGGVRRR